MTSSTAPTLHQSDKGPAHGSAHGSVQGSALFPDARAVILVEEQVAEWTKRINVARDPDTQEGSIPGGYTYLGQFVAHDLVPGNNAGRRVLPRLNLDSVYGNGLEFLDQDGRFRLGVADPSQGDKVVDLARKVAGVFVSIPGADGVAFIADARNDENVIIAQIHLMFQKIHNDLFDRLRTSIGSRLASDAARRMNVYLFHRLLIDDFLPRIMAPKVSDFLLLRGERFLIPGQLTAVPPEFSGAAFRFGHSMVRQRYTLRYGRSFTLDELLARGRGIAPEKAIDWDALFGAAGPNMANCFDLEVAPALSRVNTPSHGIMNLAKANIVASIGLGSGAQIHDWLIKSPDRLKFALMGIRSITDQDIREVTGVRVRDLPPMPLWIYLLIEAMCHQKFVQRGELEPTSRFPGRTLGPLASLIIGEVVLAAMRSAPLGLYSGECCFKAVLPECAQNELWRLLHKLGRVSVQGLIREFPSCVIN